MQSRPFLHLPAKWNTHLCATVRRGGASETSQAHICFC